MSQEPDELVLAALAARQAAYAPYSNFLVGAAVRTRSGHDFCGCNVENASYGLCLCAERVAAVAAVAAGHREFERIVIATSGQAAPCGACRQFLAEFSRDLTVDLVDVERPTKITRFNLAELLPHQFRL